MSGIASAVSAGLCASSGVGVESAWRLALGSDSALERQEYFASPKNGDRLFGIARGADCRRNSKLSFCGRILMAAVDDALKGVDLNGIDPRRIGVWFGTSIGGIFEAENMLCANLADGDSPNLRPLAFYECSTLAEFVARRVKARGECATYSTACSSSGIALADACSAIERGDVDLAFACGADSLSRITVNGFASLLLLSKGECAPFDKNRDGINLGEGACVVAVMRGDFARARGQKILAEFGGWSRSADAWHPTSPSPDGEGAARAMLGAIRSAGLSPADIDGVNAHGTGTKGNDAAEVAAMRKVFIDAIPPFFSVKNAFGHTLGASGLLNVAISIKAMENGIIPPSRGFSSFADDVGISPNERPLHCDAANILTSSLGFGGNNASFVVSRAGTTRRAPHADRNPLYLYSASALEGDPLCDIFDLLVDIAPMKKRRWAKLQQMGLEAASRALGKIETRLAPERTGVCLGTGLGMTAETGKFIRNIFDRHEQEPLPTAFTNSVHNAAASLVSIRFGLKGLNSAVTAKEISFECALAQISRAIGDGEIDAAVGGSLDEYSAMAEDFIRNFSRSPDSTACLSDFAGACFVGRNGICESAPLAKISMIDIVRADKSAAAEAANIKDSLSAAGLDLSDLTDLYAFPVSGKFRNGFLDSLSNDLGRDFTRMGAKFKNYSLSASAPLKVLGGKGIFAFYTLASCGMRALTVYETL